MAPHGDVSPATLRFLEKPGSEYRALDPAQQSDAVRVPSPRSRCGRLSAALAKESVQGRASPLFRSGRIGFGRNCRRC